MKSLLSAAMLTVLLIPATHAADTRSQYTWMTELAGDWILSPASQQEGGATRHKLVAPLVGTDATGISFRVIGKGSTVQESLLPGTGKEMVTMYHCLDATCTRVKATHYCVKQNQPEMLLDVSSKGDTLVFNCDMSTDLCQSQQDHVHSITHRLSSDQNHLITTYTSWNGGKYTKDSVYHFDRK